MTPAIPILATLAFLLIPKGDKGGRAPADSRPLPRVWDPVSAQRIARLHPSMRAAATMLLTRAEMQGIKLRITSGDRSYAEQDALYAQGRTKPGGIVTNAKAGESWHNFALAIDVVPIDKNGHADWDGPWERIGEIGKSIGLEWGGDWKTFKDRPHFQMRHGRTLQEMRALVASGRTAGGYVVV